jgi:SAM-dependent methyltransferase
VADRKIEDLERTWDHFGSTDPLWAVLARPEMRCRRWDPAAFLATGETEIAAALDTLCSLGIEPGAGHALDFGCGAGRLSRALASRFDIVTAVDVSTAMLEEARRLNPDTPNVRFVHNPRADLSIIPTGSVDLVYSRLVLQHIPPDLALGYVAEFVRVLAEGGVAMFQVPVVRPPSPTYRRTVSRVKRAFVHGHQMGIYVTPLAVRDALRRGGHGMAMYGVPPAAIRDAVCQGGGSVLHELEEHATTAWPGIIYIAAGRVVPGRSSGEAHPRARAVTAR